MVNAQVYGKGGAVVFCDMGSGQPELLDMVKIDEIVDGMNHQLIYSTTNRSAVSGLYFQFVGITPFLL